MTPPGPFDRLPSGTRRQLETFSQKVDRIPLDVLPMYAPRPLGDGHQRAADNAERVAVESGRQTIVAEVRRIAWDYIDRRHAEAAFRPGLGMVGLPPIASGPERARLATSFEDAITAIVLSDVLDEADVDELLGVWANLVH